MSNPNQYVVHFCSTARARQFLGELWAFYCPVVRISFDPLEADASQLAEITQSSGLRTVYREYSDEDIRVTLTMHQDQPLLDRIVTWIERMGDEVKTHGGRVE